MAYILSAKELKMLCVPMSYKAYVRFMVRIQGVITDVDMQKSMINAFNLYICGGFDDVYADGLNKMCRLGFALLRDEIDRAIIRSERARERARLRKEKRTSESSPIPVKMTVTAVGDIPMSRRERRAKARSEIRKLKWRPLVRRN